MRRHVVGRHGSVTGAVSDDQPGQQPGFIQDPRLAVRADRILHRAVSTIYLVDLLWRLLDGRLELLTEASHAVGVQIRVLESIHVFPSFR